MRDELMLHFLEEANDSSFAAWRAWCVDHGHPHGSFSEFVGRLSRCQEAMRRRGSLG
jgi:hypothetical protein